jgi:hypothetical protein
MKRGGYFTDDEATRAFELEALAGRSAATGESE